MQARRLCEAGAGYVTIHASYAGVWDMHADGNNLNMQDGMDAVGYSFDHAVAALIEDCEARGLSDKIMLVCCGEMGRTPKLNKRGGRDHWAKLAPLMIYGGGFDGGRVIGQSDRMGGEPVTDAFNPRHLIFDHPPLGDQSRPTAAPPERPNGSHRTSRSPSHHRFGLNQAEPHAKARRREKVHGRAQNVASPLVDPNKGLAKNSQRCVSFFHLQHY